MGESGVFTLVVTAVVIGLTHTLLGPDHYLPFIAMARAGRWSNAKTVAITIGCGVAHVLSSVVLGAVGIALGLAVSRIDAVESFRGNLAGWALLGFGVAYAAWGVRRAHRAKPHKHWHHHADGTAHEHLHSHDRQHAHVHAAPTQSRSLTPWVLFTIFIFGPCEPLIPLLMFPAARLDMAAVVLVVLAYGVTTIVTMTAVVWCCLLGFERLRLGWLERYTHVFAGLTLTVCGAAVLLGW